MNKLIKFIYIFLLLLPNILTAGDISFEGESDWTMYQYNGQHTGYNDKDKIDLPLELKWSRRYQVDSFEFNPPIIVGERIVVTNRLKYSPADPTISIRCIDIHSGEIIWGWSFSGIHTIDPPIYYDSAVYVQVVNIGGMLYSYNLLDGSRRWRLPFYSQFSKQLGPVIQNNSILFLSGSYGGLTKANAKTGEFIWWRRLGDYDFQAPAIHGDNNFYIWNAGISGWTSDPQEMLWRNTIIYPVPSDIGGGPCIDTTEKIIFLEHPSNVFAVDMITHEVLWTNNHPYPSTMSAGFTITTQGLTPAICEDRLYYIHQDSLYSLISLQGKIFGNTVQIINFGHLL